MCLFIYWGHLYQIKTTLLQLSINTKIVVFEELTIANFVFPDSWQEHIYWHVGQKVIQLVMIHELFFKLQSSQHCAILIGKANILLDHQKLWPRWVAQLVWERLCMGTWTLVRNWILLLQKMSVVHQTRFARHVYTMHSRLQKFYFFAECVIKS